jgi:hypothetical protein
MMDKKNYWRKGTTSNNTREKLEMYAVREYRESLEEKDNKKDATWVPGERDGHDQLLEEGDHQHHHQKEVGDVSCAISRHIRMPGSIIQASQGGTCPRTYKYIPVTNYNEFEENERTERESQEEKDSIEDTTCVPGGREEDNKRYLEFLKYFEERRKRQRGLEMMMKQERQKP